MMQKRLQLELSIQALKGAAMGIAAAIDDQSITSHQVYALLFTLINQLESSQSLGSKEETLT